MKLKLISLILALALCVSCFSACGKTAAMPTVTGTTPESSDPTETVTQTDISEGDAEAEADAESEADAEAEAEARYQKYLHAYGKHDPDAVVMNVNGQDIRWRDFFSWLYDIMAQMEDSLEITDWSAPFTEMEDYLNDPTYGSYAFSFAAQNASQIAVLFTKAAEQGITLTDAQSENLDATMQSYYDSYGGEDAFLALIQQHFLTEDYFRQQTKAMMLYQNLFENAYGKNAERFPADEAVAYARSCGYMYAKHILFSTVDDDSNPLPEETIAEKKALAEQVLAELQGYPVEELEANFDRLAQEYSEDPGLMYSPDGYYFLPGEMVEPFETATKALGEMEMSGIVESDFGYHIIFCPVLQADAIVGYNSDYEPFTPRDMGAAEEFNTTVQSWFTDALIIPSDEFASPDLNELLAP